MKKQRQSDGKPFFQGQNVPQSLHRKAMTNLDSVLKSRGITLPTKVHIVKAVDFLVVIHGCESWIIKKAERLEELILSNCGVR